MMTHIISHALAANITINPNIPYVSSGADFPSLIQGFYLYALAIGGILAFGAIVYGGVKYATGRGNPSTESEGKSWITSALLGLLLLGGAYIVLHTVNPALTILSMPGLPALSAASSNSVTGPTSPYYTYGCVAANGVYACSASGKDSTCSDAQGCSGKKCIQVPKAACKQTASGATAGSNCDPNLLNQCATGLTCCQGANSGGTLQSMCESSCTGFITPTGPTSGGTVGSKCDPNSATSCQTGLHCCTFLSCKTSQLQSACEASCSTTGSCQ